MMRRLVILVLVMCSGFWALGQISGTKTIGGTSPDYTSIQQAVDSLKANGVSGAVTLNIRQGTYNERVEIDTISGQSATNTITFQADPANTSEVIWEDTLTSGEPYVLLLDGASDLIFKNIHFGDLGGVSGRTIDLLSKSINITIDSCELTSTSAQIAVGRFFSTAFKVDSFYIINSIIDGYTRGVGFEGGGTSNDFVVFDNTQFLNMGQTGMFVDGFDSIDVRNCYFEDWSQEALRLEFSKSAVVENNKFIATSGNTGNQAIYTWILAPSAGIRNKFVNNLVHVSKSSMAIQDRLFYLRSIAGRWDIHHNTIVYEAVDGDTIRNSSIFNFRTQMDVDVRNNILYYDGAGKIYDYNDAAAITGTQTFDYNNIYSTSDTLASVEGNLLPTLDSLWAYGMDSNSFELDPYFDSDTTFVPQSGAMDNQGDPSAGVTADIDGNSRSLTTPDVGAYEYTGCTALSGTYTIGGTSPSYATIGEAVDDLNICGVTGAVTFNIRQGTYNETIELFEVHGVSASNTITFQPDPANTLDVIIQDSASSEAPYVVSLDGTDYIEFDNLNFDATGLSSADVIYITGENYHITIDSCDIDASNVQYAIYAKPGHFVDMGWLIVTNNTTDGPVELTTTTGAGISHVKPDSTLVENNTILDGWLQVSYHENYEVIDNYIHGGGLGNSYGNQFLLESNIVDSAVGGAAITCFRSNNGTLINNVGKSNENGLRMESGGGFDVYNNTFVSVSTNPLSRAISFSGSGSSYNVSGSDFRNNIFAAFDASHAFRFGSNNTYDYNCYYSESDTLGQIDSVYAADIGEMLFSSQDTNSVGYSPLFDEGSFVPTHPALDDLGIVISGITHDVDGVLRDTVNPDLGAFEFDPQPLAGIYKVGGAGFDFGDLEEAVTALNAVGVDSLVEFHIRSGTYTGQLEIDSIVGGSSTNYVKFMADPSASTTPVIEADADVINNHTIKLDGADNVTFYNLSIEALDSSFSRVLHIAGRSDSITVDSCDIIGIPSTGSGSAQALIYDQTGTAFESNHFTLSNSYLLGGSYGVILQGISALVHETGITITDNYFDGPYYSGIRLFGQDDAVIAGNEIYMNPSSGLQQGIDISYADSLEIANNMVETNSSGGYKGMQLANLDGTSSSTNRIYNNMVWNGASNAVVSYPVYITSSSHIDFFFNSMEQNSSDTSAGAIFMNSGNQVDVRNNVFSNSGAGVAYRVGNPTPTNWTSENNCLYSAGVNVGYYSAAFRTDLAAWQSATGKDTNSVSGDPGFLAADDLHSFTTVTYKAGQTISGYAYDIDGDDRKTPPSIGADEFDGPVEAEIIDVSDTVVCYPDSIVLLADTSEENVTYKWLLNGALMGGETDSVLTVFNSGSYQVVMSNSISVDTSDAVGITVQALPVVSIGSYTTFCIDDDTFNLTSAVPIGGYFTGNGLLDSSGTFLPASATVGLHSITYTYADSLGCTDSSSTTLQVDSLPDVSLTSFSNVCINAAPFSLSGGSSSVSDGYGIYAGDAVTNGTTFDASLAVPGNNTVTYTFVDTLSECSSDTSLDLFVDTLPIVTLSSFTDLCLEDSAAMSGGSPSGGVYFGVGVLADSLNYFADSAGSFNIYYTYTDNTTGCTDVASNVLIVNDLPTVVLGSIPSACIHDDTVQITSQNPTGGFFSGTGIIDSTAGYFSPDIAGVDTFSITYTYTDANGCVNVDSNTIVINDYPNISLVSYADVCIDIGSFTLTNGSSTNTGVGEYSGPGVLNGSTFVPTLSDTGTHTLTYTFTDTLSGCVDDTSSTIRVNPLPVLLPATQDEYCIGSSEDTLVSPTPTGGAFYGIAIDSDSLTFMPDTAGVGLTPVYYRYTDPATACINTLSFNVRIHPLPSVSLDPLGEVCASDQFTLSGGQPTGGYFTGSGVNSDSVTFTANSAGHGSHNVGYHFIDGNTCQDSTSQTIFVNRLPKVSVTTPAGICADSDVITLSFATTDSSGTGFYSGVGVTNNDQFFASVSGTGAHRIAYTFTDINGCIDTDTATQTVFALPQVSTGILSNYCVSIASDTLNSGTPSGGIFFGTAITSDSIFGPASAGVGIHNLSYTYVDANGCTDTATRQLEVYALPSVSIGVLGAVCLNSGTHVLNTGTPSGGFYSGNTVNGDEFFPGTAGVGSYTIQYSYTDSNSCASVDSASITVNAIPNVTLSTIPDVCYELGSTTLTQGSPVGGLYSTPDTTHLIGNIFNTYASGSGSFNIFYHYTDGNGCSDTTQNILVVRPQPTVGLNLQSRICQNAGLTLLSGGIPLGGTYYGNAVSGSNYDPLLVGTGLDTVYYRYTDIHGCNDTVNAQIIVDSVPVVTLAPQPSACTNASSFLLTGGNPTGSGGVYSGAPGILNGIFNPQLAGADTHTVVYTFTDSLGCFERDTQNLIVHAPPMISFASQWSVCRGLDSVALLGAAPMGGYFTGNHVDSVGNFLPDSAGTGVFSVQYSFTDTNTGCTDSASQTVTVFSKPLVGLTQNSRLCIDDQPFVPNGGIPLGVGGVYSARGMDSTGTYFPDSAGIGLDTLTFIYTDQNGCTDSAKQEIEIFAQPVVSLSSFGDACFGDDAATLTQGIPSGGTYTGTGVLANRFFPSIADTGIHAIQYQYTDSNGCSSDTTGFLRVFPLPLTSISGDTTVCQNTAVGITASGGISFDWSAGESSSSIQVLAANTEEYRVTITSQLGCSVVEEVKITVYDTMAVVQNIVQPSCEELNGRITLQVNGGKSPYRYDWSHGANTAQVVNLGSGVYRFEVTDQNNCVKSSIVGLSNNGGPSITLDTIIHNDCFGDANGSIALQSGTGVYSWSNGQKGTSLSGLEAGTYQVQVEDDDCKTFATYTVNEPSSVNASAVLGNPSCGAADGFIAITSEGGTGAHTFNWNTGSNSDSLTFLAAGIYSITITDSKSCTSEETIILNNNVAPNMLLDSLIFANCGSSDGGIFLTPADTGLAYTWSNGPTSEDNPSITSGLYTLTVTQSSTGCNRFLNFDVLSRDLAPVELCYVTNDTVAGANELKWTAFGGLNFSSYKVLREKLFGFGLDTIATIGQVGTNTYLDTTLDNTQLTAGYSILVEDVCGRFTDHIEPHESILLVANIKSSNVYRLDWTSYVGTSISDYYVYRYSGSGGLELIDSVNNNINVYVDLNAPEEDSVLFYFVQARKVDNCDPSHNNIIFSNYSRNLIDKEIIGLAESPNELGIKVFPNPTEFELNIAFERRKGVEPVLVKIINLQGKTLRAELLDSSGVQEHTVRLDGLASGAYHLMISVDGRLHVERIIVR